MKPELIALLPGPQELLVLAFGARELTLVRLVELQEGAARGLDFPPLHPTAGLDQRLQQLLIVCDVAVAAGVGRQLDLGVQQCVVIAIQQI